jgi:hypothetical protein
VLLPGDCRSEAVGGNAARLPSAPTLCLCMIRPAGEIGRRMLLVPPIGSGRALPSRLLFGFGVTSGLEGRLMCELLLDARPRRVRQAERKCGDHRGESTRPLDGPAAAQAGCCNPCQSRRTSPSATW